MALSNFIRRILGAGSFPLFRDPIDQIEPQVYQPPLVPKQEFAPPPPDLFTTGADNGISQRSDQ